MMYLWALVIIVKFNIIILSVIWRFGPLGSMLS